MSRLLGLQKAPVFVEQGDAKVTAEFGKNIKDYPTQGKRGDHNGIDLVRCTDGKNSTAATVCAIADGVVTAQRKWVKGFKSDSATGGNCVYIKHGNGMTSKYLHLKYGTVPDRIADGAAVKKGETLGYMGATGLAYGSHLHFQVEDENGTPVDPEPYLLGKKSFDKTAARYRLALAASYESKSDAEAAAAYLKKAGVSVELLTE
ncbi:MAG: M23 family metallopeptidase [Clostridia bacterium]|nr:M23 family metallopeptidase [Clostridia bacterium]